MSAAAALADAIGLLRWTHKPHECECPAVCGTCRTVSGLRRVLDSTARPGTNEAHARLHGPMFHVRRRCAVS